jgi:5-methyltetrahydropteroyltriglutamate--homocysteine methyltransferase
MSSTAPLVSPFRADVVGSYLRPDYLHAARGDFAAGRIDAAALQQIEDRAITELVARQKAAGLQVITDGEFRRSWWHLDFMWGLQGVAKAQLQHGYRFAAMETRPETARLTGPLDGSGHPFIAHFRFLQGLADSSVLPRLTVPAPAQFFKELHRPENLDATQAVYPSREALIEAIEAAYRRFIAELHAAGCRSLQFDDCTWGTMVDPRYSNAGVTATNAGDACCEHGAQATVISASMEELAIELLDVNNRALAGIPADMVITTHVCRGNYRSTWAAQGGYGPIAPFLLLAAGASVGRQAGGTGAGVVQDW